MTGIRSKEKCTCTIATTRNTPDVRSGHELGGYFKVKDPNCPVHYWGQPGALPSKPSALQPCPFCGCDAWVHEGAAFSDGQRGHRVECEGPNCHGMTCWWHSEAEAKAAWNRRASEATIATPRPEPCSCTIHCAHSGYPDALLARGEFCRQRHASGQNFLTRHAPDCAALQGGDYSWLACNCGAMK